MWRIEEVDGNGGIDVDSSEENIGKVDVDRSKSGGIDGFEDDRILLEDCGGIVGMEDCRVVVAEDCRTGGSHMECFLMTIVDVRRMYDSLQLHSLPLLDSQIVEQTAQIYNRGKADCCTMAAECCKKENNFDADNHKIFRFEINVDNNNDNNKRQSHNNGRTCVCNGPNGVGMCKSSFEGSRVEI